MGIAFSRTAAVGSAVAEVVESETMSETDEKSGNENNGTLQARDREMIAFKEQLRMKREQRRDILARHKAEKENLKKSLELEHKAREDLSEENKLLRQLLLKNNIDFDTSLQVKEENDLHDTIESMKKEFVILKENNMKLRRDLAESNLSLHQANSDITNLQCQSIESANHISALKEVVSVSKTMIKLREQQLNELKDKLTQIEQSLADREANLLSTDLRQEYERQLLNIRTLRTLYEERARLAEVTRLNLLRELEEQKLLNVTEIKKCKELTDKVEELELKVKELTESIENKDDLINSCQNETRDLQIEMSTVNKLFSQVLLGYKSKQNLDQLVHRLEENHGILTHMAERENDSEASSALPKLLLELVSQVDENNEIHQNNLDGDVASETNQQQNTQVTGDFNGNADGSYSMNTTPEEIVRNLPKVWKVLMELLSHQIVSETNATEKTTTCYKSVETSSGSVLVPSVSQTYIRLKDLIVEKLALIKEVNSMKQLNGHLETRLEEQERRLCLVTSELSKTWHVVGRLRRHHHQLHTHEKILKYELQQKRKLLNELKEELEYCREKWEKAREKNTQSEKDWRKLRAEFTSRRAKVNSPFNNSGESGYSDERPSDDTSESNDESEYINEPPLRSKRKPNKTCDVLDSSADINLIAEREDPISDMIDVADLPLDGQEIEENVENRDLSPQTETEDISISESENISRCEQPTDDLENDVCDLETELCPKTESDSYSDKTLENNANTSDTHQDGNTNIELSASNQDFTVKPIIDPAAILESIKRQNERLAKRDAKLQTLEREGTALLRKTQDTANLSEQINSTLDHLLNRPGTSAENTQITEIDDNNRDALLCTNSTIKSEDNEQSCDNINNELLENITYSKIPEKEDEPCNYIETKSEFDLQVNDNELIVDSESTGNAPPQSLDEPSTSKAEVNHEARFAARDERLKRLEEQAKSLVKKVNNTKNKRIKLHYKLEELHNIYGSENSRASTPSGENDDEDNNDNED